MATVKSNDYVASQPAQQQQGVDVADPNGVANGLVSDVKKGATVYTFDSNAPPGEKAAVTARPADVVGGPNLNKAPAGREVLYSAANGPAVKPTITIEDVDAATAAEDKPQAPQPMPGMIAADDGEYQIPDWYKVGWRQVGGKDTLDPNIPDRPIRPAHTLLSEFISESFFGQWWFDSAVIVVAVVFTHLLTLLHASWAWIFLLLGTCATYYSTSNARTLQRARDDIQRQLVRNRIETDFESAEWINSFLERFWLIYEPVLSRTIVQSVDQLLQDSTPAFLDSMHLSTFSLGTKAPRLDKVKTYPRTADDVVLMEIGLSFIPNDTTHLTVKEAADKVNPKIIMDIRVGASIAKATFPILLEDFSFKAVVRVRLDLTTTFPHVKTVELSFIEKPQFDFELKPIGGETFGFDIGFIPGLKSWIQEMVHSILGPMMYDPNAYVLNLAQLLSGTPLDSAIGVLQVRIYQGRGLKGVKVTGGSPDPYVILTLNDKDELARTKWQPQTSNPYWNEVKFILVNNLTDQLTLRVMDYNEVRKDMDLGVCNWDLAQLKDDAVREGIQAKVLKDGKERGDIQFDVSFYPVIVPKKLPNGETEPLPETKSGILRLTVHQAKELDHSKSTNNELSPFAKVYYGQQEVYRTVRRKHTNNPVWEMATEILVPDRHARAAVVSIEIIDDREVLRDPLVGRLSIKLDDLLARDQDQWLPLKSCRSGRIRLTAEWKALNMVGSMEGAGDYVPPIGVVRLWMQKAVDVKNVEGTLGGKSDPYVRVIMNGVIKARTEVVNNNLNPEWDQIIYVPVHQLRESLLLEVMDYQNLTKDRSLGTVELKIAELAAVEGDSRIPYRSKGKREAADNIRLDKGHDVFKGKLHYVAEFYPAVHLKNATFEESKSEMQGAVEDSQNTQAPAGAGTQAVGANGSPAKSAQEPASPKTVSAAEPRSPTNKGHARAVSIATVSSIATNATAETATDNVDDGIEMSKDEVLQSQSGIVAFNVISGTLAKRARLEILIDEGYWPAFGTIKARSTNARWEQVGEGFIKELDFSEVRLRLNEKDEGDQEAIVAVAKMKTKEFLEKTLDGPSTFTLDNGNGENKSTIEITSRYIPVDVVLEEREKVSNMGYLRVSLIDGKNIRGMDRSGKSDPYAVFALNGQRVFKSQTQKKTLTPVWNEHFEVLVPSRVAASFSIEVFDWNQIENARSIGQGTIELSNIEPFEAKEVVVELVNEKLVQGGEIRISMVFRPEIIAHIRQPTSTMGAAGRAMTRVGTMPMAGIRGVATGVGMGVQGVGGVVGMGVSGVGGVVSGVGHGVGKATHIFQKKDRQGTTIEEVVEEPAPMSAAPTVSSTMEFPSATSETNPTVDSLASSSLKREGGFLKVRVLAAKDLALADSIKPHVHLRVGEKEFKTKHSKGATPEWDETFPFSVVPNVSALHVLVLDHKTLGKDKELGEADVNIWDQLQSGVSTSDIWVELRPGPGQIHLRMEYIPGNQTPPRASTSSFSSPGKLGNSPSRFSLHNASR